MKLNYDLFTALPLPVINPCDFIETNFNIVIRTQSSSSGLPIELGIGLFHKSRDRHEQLFFMQKIIVRYFAEIAINFLFIDASSIIDKVIQRGVYWNNNRGSESKHFV